MMGIIKCEYPELSIWRSDIREKVPRDDEAAIHAHNNNVLNRFRVTMHPWMLPTDLMVRINRYVS